VCDDDLLFAPRSFAGGDTFAADRLLDLQCRRFDTAVAKQIIKRQKKRESSVLLMDRRRNRAALFMSRSIDRE
jgi:hypothetical protein